MFLSVCFIRKNIPVYTFLFQAMGMEDAGLTCGAVCVYPNRVAECVEALKRFTGRTAGNYLTQKQKNNQQGLPKKGG